MNTKLIQLLGLFIASVSCTALPQYNTTPDKLSEVISKGKPASNTFEKQIVGYGWKLTSIHLLIYGQVSADEYQEYYGSGVNSFYFDKNSITCYYYALGNHSSWTRNISYDSKKGIVSLNWIDDKDYEFIQVISVKDDVLTTVEHVNSIAPELFKQGHYAVKTYNKMSSRELDQTINNHSE